MTVSKNISALSKNLKTAAPLPRPRSNTRVTPTFSKKVYTYMSDFVEDNMSELSPQKRREFLSDRFSSIRRMGTQVEVVDWLLSEDRRGFIGIADHWMQQFGDQDHLQDEVLGLLKGIGNTRADLALVAMGLNNSWKLGYPSHIQSEIKAGDVTANNLKKLLTGLQWAKTVKLPRV